LQEADIGDRRNQLLVAVSIGLGMVPVVRPEFFAHLPHWMEPITHSGIAVATLSAVTLNLLFNVLGGPERHALTGAAHHCQPPDRSLPHAGSLHSGVLPDARQATRPR